MILQPKIRGFICTTAHPVGCAKRVQDEIDYVQERPLIRQGPKKALIIGASTGYGLSSRIVAAFGGSRAATIGVFFEKEAENGRTATAGYYNSAAFEQKAREAGLYAKSFNGDAFSDEMKQKVMETIKKDLGSVDLVIYSLASPRRQHPRTGQLAKSVLKPVGTTFSNKSLDLNSNKLENVTLAQASQEEIDQTISVMGGEDWEMWIEALKNAGLLERHALTVAYSYIGPELTRGVYRNGTIGKAKDHLEATARKLDEQLKKYGGRALISVNKALVTQSSSAIPFIPLYFILLKKVMKEKKVDEDCIGQIHRLFATRLYTGGPIPVDENGFARLDDWEMRQDVQREVRANWDNLSDGNLTQYADLDGYQKDFLRLFGFGLEGVNYDAEVETDLKLPSTLC
ncbi:MAG TPA: bifunctional NADH-specific enoyl-ACP reductase/trans-2-enoyl-CoA reductase [Candidatus Omnitrophica bacterium]|nr:MAG: trans-2-enoyl-CoA reductase [Omnitrophica WOR_2 bacterium GWA2_45_18]OGX19984.1 MAG: trans-2-enoyl-CoA reductase [Omnitrophica WOR_2 bacterium GWC2_45_7]HBR14761.1 bifunctional NADH-specific enoyl-ACP reductase/trans-2-enoyl-CoA reductase [Candidatus Omnitrophota bacterium]